MTRTLRKWQAEAIEAVRDEWSSGVSRTAVVAATGLGKSSVIGKLAVDEVHAGGRVLLLAHREELLTQLTDTCKAFDEKVPVGRVQGGMHQARRPITVASVATVRNPKRQSRMIKPTLIVVDECHRAVSPSHMKTLAWAGAFDGTRALGVTATMIRGDKKGLGDVWESVALVRDIKFGIDEGYLVKPRGRVVVAHHMDLNKAKVSRGDYQDGELGEMVAQDADEIVKAWVEHASDRLTVAFVPTVDSAHELRDAFLAQGVAAEAVIGSTPTAERTAMYARLASGETRVLVNVFVLVEGWDCLDSETEILTASGWRGMGQVQAGDIVQSLNRETGLLELVPATRYVERPMNPDERMFTATSQHMDIRTSEGHEFHVRSRRSSAFETVTGTDLAHRRAPYSLPLAAPSAQSLPGVDLTDDEIRFVAWFMTDGGFAGTKVEITQAKDYKDEIRALLTRLGMDFAERVREPGAGAYPNAKPFHVFRIPKGTHGGSLQRSGWNRLAAYLNKDVANVLHQMTREQFLVFWEELLKGDGDRRWLTCDRQSQVDAYTMMAAVRGLSASYRTRMSSSGVPWFRVSVRDEQWITSNPADPRSTRLTLEDPRDGERVWCVTNRNSTLVTRRGGKIAIIGNCPPVSCILMARPTRLPGVYIQALGRGLRQSPGKTDCLVLDVVGTSRFQKLVTLVDLHESAEYDTEELDALPCAECGGALRGQHLTEDAPYQCTCPAEPLERDPDGGRVRLIGPAKYEDLDFFAESELNWLFTRGGTRFLPAGDRMVVLWPEEDGELYTAGHCTMRGVENGRFVGRDGHWDPMGPLPLNEARKRAEELALAVDPTVASRNASWRKRGGAPSPMQVQFALGLGIVDPATMNKARLSDEISIALASRVF